MSNIKLFLLGKIRLIWKDLVSIKLSWLLLCTFLSSRCWQICLIFFFFPPEEGNQLYNSRANIHMYKLISQLKSCWQVNLECTASDSQMINWLLTLHSWRFNPWRTEIAWPIKTMLCMRREEKGREGKRKAKKYIYIFHYREIYSMILCIRPNLKLLVSDENHSNFTYVFIYLIHSQ